MRFLRTTGAKPPLNPRKFLVVIGKASREKEKAELFLASNRISGITAETVGSSIEFLTYASRLYLPWPDAPAGLAPGLHH
jgi:hypothetical protein